MAIIQKKKREIASVCEDMEKAEPYQMPHW